MDKEHIISDEIGTSYVNGPLLLMLPAEAAAAVAIWRAFRTYFAT